jgi:predicted transcriptional regulator
MSTTAITIHPEPELANKIAALASAVHRSEHWVVEEALKQYIDVQMGQIKGIEDAVASLDKGEGIAHDLIMAEAEKLLREFDGGQ